MKPDSSRPVTPPEPAEGPSQRNIDTTHTAPDPNASVTDPYNRQHQRGLQNPKLPHERDESVGMTDGEPSAIMQQAYRDVKRGLVNTDAGREAHNVGNGEYAPPADLAQPTDPVQPGTPTPVEPDRK